MSSLDFQTVRRELERQRWRVEHLSSGHFRAIPPDRSMRIVHYSTSSEPRAIRNTIAQLRASGFRWNEREEQREPDAVNGVADEASSERAPNSFGEALRTARTREGLAQHEIGELVGVTGQAVAAWECEANIPVVPNWNALVTLFPDLESFRPSEIRDMDKPNGGAQHPRASSGRPERNEREEIEIAYRQVMALSPEARLQVIRRLIKDVGGFRPDLTVLNVAEPRETRAPEGEAKVPESQAEIKASPTPEPTFDRAALIRWSRLVAAVRACEDEQVFVALLQEAFLAEMTLSDVCESLEVVSP